jgi:hypothetical protein
MPEGGALTLLADLIARMEQVASMQQEAMGAQRLPGSGNFAFRRMSGVLQVPVALTATTFEVPKTFFTEGPAKGATSFGVYNPNPCPVQLRGSKSQVAFPTDQDGWIPFPPGFWGVFSTQYPDFMSARAIIYPWFEQPAQFAPLWLTYGGGA